MGSPKKGDGGAMAQFTSEGTRKRNLENNPMWSDAAKKKSSISHMGFKQSDDHKRKTSLRSKEMWEDRRMSGEMESHARKISDSKKGVVMSDSHRCALSVAQKKRFDNERLQGKRPPKKVYLKKGSKESNENISRKTKEAMSRLSVESVKRMRDANIRHRDEHIALLKNLHKTGRISYKKISETVTKQLMAGKYGRPVHPYNGKMFKSTWEVAVAKWMDERDVGWEYEPIIHVMKNGRRYVPDFRIDGGEFLEVKGRATERAIEKMNDFVDAGNVLWVIDDVENGVVGVMKRWAIGGK